MGAYQNNEAKSSKGKGNRGSVRNADRLAAFASGGGDGGGDWAVCHSELLQAVVCKITALGGAVTFGLSRDKGAHSLTLLLDGNRKTMWYNGEDDLDEKLGEVIATLEGMQAQEA